MTNTTPPPSGQYPPPQYPPPVQYGPPQQFARPPVKPDHTVRNVLLGVFGGLTAVFFLGLIVVVTVTVLVVSSTSTPLADDPVPGPVPAPVETTEPVPVDPVPVDPAPVDPTTEVPVVPEPVPTEAQAPEVPVEPVPPVEPTVPDDTGGYANAVETRWKSGVDWEARPESKNITRFNAKYDKPASWLKSIGKLPDGLKIVITNDPELNCGWTLVYRPHDQVGGCYRSEYGKTLFMFWGKNSTSAMKELVLLHELSHFEQQWDHFDVVQSAYDSDVPASDIKKVIETDATCRVYEEWGFSEYRYLDADTSSPCGSSDWNPRWMEAKFKKFGVVIEDW
jgi:hypothetical protein